MLSTFNCGICMAIVVPRELTNSAIRCLHEPGVQSWSIGEIIESSSSERVIFAVRDNIILIVVSVSGNESNLQAIID